MLKFLVVMGIGALGYWAYKQGMLPASAREMVDRVMPHESPIITPTPHEIAGRPSEPIPG
jgi:hypothetical protein